MGSGMPLVSFDSGSISRSAPIITEPFARYSKRSFYPLKQAVGDWDELDGELKLPRASTMVMIVVSSALGSLGLFAILAWLRDAL